MATARPACVRHSCKAYQPTIPTHPRPHLSHAQVKDGQYVAYMGESPADVNAVGVTLDGTSHVTRADAVAACEADAECVGVSRAAGAAAWRTFAGTRWEGAVGRVRVVGEAVNSWVAEPTGA